MFDAQTAALIRSAPILAGVDPEMLPQELTGIYAELAGLRLRAAALAEQPDYLAQLERIERIATIYEALVDNGAEDHERRAAAFVAATAYQLLGRIRPALEERDQLLTTRAIDPRVSAPLLFLIAEQSPDLLLLSAMLKNAGEVADWLETITGRPCVGFYDPWKPSRQARGVVIYPKAQVDAANVIVRRKKRLKKAYQAPPLNADAYALFGLHHAWLKTVAADTVPQTRVRA